MAAITLRKIVSEARLLTLNSIESSQKRSIVTNQSGALLPRPKQVPFGLFRVVLTVISGLLVGATISKTMANFLEENDLFVPSDDDDDDD